jgi:hypothetical protein
MEYDFPQKRNKKRNKRKKNQGYPYKCGGSRRCLEKNEKNKENESSGK